MDKKLLMMSLGATLVPAAAFALPVEGDAEGEVMAEARGTQKRPNVIWIMTDQHWAGAMSCAGNADVRTPNLDRLAKRGVRFENAYCAMPLSGPSRAAMFTGYMPSQTGMDVNEKPLVDSLRHNTLGQLVADAGYDCVYAGKWHVNTISIPDGEFGFRNIRDNGDEGLAEACVDYLESRYGLTSTKSVGAAKRRESSGAKSGAGLNSPSGNPFFMVASFINPHNICEYARGQKTPHAPTPVAEIPDCPNLPANFEKAPYDAAVLSFEQRQNYSLYPSVDYSPDDWRRYRNAYFRLIEHVDAQIGIIVDEIDRLNLWDDSIIIFTSDHGDGAGAHRWNQKTALYEEVANVPLIVCLPGGKNAGKTTAALVNNGIDMMPTLCEWTGAYLPANRPGRSFASAAALKDKGPDFIVTETNFKQTSGTAGWMVRSSRYKYVLYDKGLHREQLYDMSSGRLEMVNLAEESSYAPILAQMRAVLRNWMETTPGPDRKRHLKALPE